jgi:hypothetical protein
MTDQHPITPPLELKRQWIEQPTCDDGVGRELWLIDRAAQWGADQELEACCQLLDFLGEDGERLRLHRRPKPPSLKEQALEEVGVFEGMGTCNIDIIRRALEAIPDE